MILIRKSCNEFVQGDYNTFPSPMGRGNYNKIMGKIKDCQRQPNCPKYSTVRAYLNEEGKRFYWLSCAWWPYEDGVPQLCPKAYAYKRACASKAPGGVIEFETPQAAKKHFYDWFWATKDAECSLWEAYQEELKTNPKAEFTFDASPYMRWEP